ncbi:acyl-CoA thioesterase [Amycolatopsis vastitatis]|uniref:Acyl-CoA thioesterase II n=1 Tax=Amycolatopsis vastitatis TaxID=1905142 RepID=A0A229SYE8_9PSEU|nr:acyl-CoA thioesterase domain-containing protein [Amycolatopsis vastitatis]OXM64085.1 acyl-CoA thioesterase II [Amycolatopsis vastitatis]
MNGSLTDRLVLLADLQRVDVDLFTALPSGEPARMFGGEAAARALAAAQLTVSADRAVHVTQATYLRPGDPSEPLWIRVDRMRDGRAFSLRRVDIEQSGKVIFTAMFSFHCGATAFEHHDPMPRVPAPEELGGLAGWTEAQAVWPRWLAGDRSLDLRPVPDRGRDSAGTRALWYRATAPVPDDPALHACLWLYASDLTLVASIRLPHERTARKTWLMTTLNHTVWFHRPFRVDEWHLVVQRSPRAGGGRGLAQAQVFTRGGELVSSLAQEGLASAIQ